MFGKAGSTALFLALLLICSTLGSGAQTTPQPRREELLNGLRILLWNRPGDANALLKLRIHSGSVFDLAGKAGMMALLADALFPDMTTREYFVEELGGRLEVTSDYDGINVTMSGRASELERMLEILRTALVSTQLTPENVGRLRATRIKLAGDMSTSPTLMADRAIAARLFGDYPLGRPAAGSPETLARIERPDLLLARERFLNPNNATLVLIGGVDNGRALRALKQLLGSWRKSETIVPATFRQPEAPDTRTLIFDLPGTETAEVRLAARGLARADADYAAATLLALLARDAWQAQQPELARSAFFVRHEGRALPGLFVLGASVPVAEVGKTLQKARQVLASLTKSETPADVLERLKSEAIAELNNKSARPESLADLWLDTDTFNLPSVEDRIRQLRNVTSKDLQRTASRLFGTAPLASVVVGSAAQLKPDIERAGKVEIFGAAPAPSPGPTPLPARKP
ncbi:MAG TPA: pitrilysin family protein [Pyrinomonadaceae bacterium]